jgi:hypothetical protein
MLPMPWVGKSSAQDGTPFARDATSTTPMAHRVRMVFRLTCLLPERLSPFAAPPRKSPLRAEERVPEIG